MKVVIVGGVAAGMSAASKIKRLDKTVKVTVYEKGDFLSYGACGLPYYVGGFNDDYRRMIARTKEEFEAAGIEINTGHEVTGLNPNNKIISVIELKTGRVFEDSYDKLIIATGAYSVMPPFKGKEKLGVHTLKTMEDGIFLKEYAGSPDIKNVVIVGGGYIGIECAEAFLNLNKSVRLIEAGDRIMLSFDKEMAEAAHTELEKKGVSIHLNEKVKAFTGGNIVEQVETDKGSYKADLVVVATGIRPATGFLENSGVKLAKNGAVIVDREMHTSVKDIYSAGDCAESYNRITEENMFLALGTVANKCGRIAGENALGGHVQFDGVLGSAAIKVCDIEMFRTGIGEEEAEKLGINFKTSIVSAYDHPGYYPGKTEIRIKLIYGAEDKVILGAQLYGEKGAVLRGDVFAVAVHNKMTTKELGMVDLAYAPPFAGVWDAIHIACNAAK